MISVKNLIRPPQKINLRRLVHSFAALGDDSRLKIVKRLLTNQNPCVSELASELGISISAVSQHLRILEMNGLVSRERMGQKTCYQLRRKDPVVKQMLNIVQLA